MMNHVHSAPRTLGMITKVYIGWRFCPQQGRTTFAGPVAVLSVITYVSDCTP